MHLSDIELIHRDTIPSGRCGERTTFTCRVFVFIYDLYADKYRNFDTLELWRAQPSISLKEQVILC
jgi:hypothetical protein